MKCLSVDYLKIVYIRSTGCYATFEFLNIVEMVSMVVILRNGNQQVVWKQFP